MEVRTLGRTGLPVGAIGLGTEYLVAKSKETVISVIDEAIGHGVNYVDLVYSFPTFLDNISVALRGRREHVILTGHLGSTVKDGQYAKSRSVNKSEPVFLDLLARLDTDRVDVLFLHNCDTARDYEQLTKPGGQLDAARRLRQEGKARFIGFSGHSVPTALRIVESGEIDVLMFPINMTANAVPGKKELLMACAAHNVGVVAMKPFAGGKLLSQERTVRMARYQMGGPALKVRKEGPITPVQCLSYVLSQAGVSTAVPGCADVDQLTAALAYLDAADEHRDFAELMSEFDQYVAGECVYCNHCLPCPSEIDIGQTMRLFDMAQQRVTEAVREAYAALPANASDCIQCGACEERCPFGVHVIEKMEQAAALLA
jgi:predicted aldo/keto reductase-like oxidoreductase